MNREERPEEQKREVGLNYLVLGWGFIYWSEHTNVSFTPESVMSVTYMESGSCALVYAFVTCSTVCDM